MTSFNEKSQDSVQGVLVQEIPNVKAIQKMQGDADIELASGVMRVLLVTFDVNNPFNDPTNEPSLSQKERAVEPESVDMWVVLEIGSNFSFPVRANQTIVPQRDTSSYTFPSADVSGAAISLVLSSDRYSSSIEQFEDLLTDYCAFQSDAKGRGTIELMDEKGHLLGTIDGPWHLEEDAGLHKSGYEKDPVLVELPPESSSSSGSFDQKIIISTAPRTEEGIIASEYQNDWLLKGATFVSKSLITGSTWAGQKMTNAADSYVSKTTPPMSRQSSTPGDYEKNPSQLSSDSSKPLTTSGRPAVTFSPKVYAASQQIKAFSGTATAVSGRTRDAVLNVAGKVGDQIGKTTGIQAQPRADGTATKPSGIRGVLNRSLIAANVVLDGLTQSAETLLSSGGEASGRAIEHRYGSEAKIISGNTASVGRSAFVVYKDINGVRRKALLKIATGTIKARAPDGSEVILQQENFQSPSAQASATVTDPPAYEKDSKADYR